MKKRLYALFIVLTLTILSAGCDKSVKISTGLKDSVIFKMSDSTCNLSEIILTLVYEKNMYETDLGSEIWSKEIEGVTFEQSVKDEIKERQIYLEALYLFALENGLDLSDSEMEKANKAATEYYSTLSPSDIDIMNITVDDIYSYYRKNFLAYKVYNLIVGNVNTEVSDEEARVIDIMYIYVESDEDKIQEAYNKVNSGADFYSVALEYSEEDIYEVYIGRGDMLEQVEKVAFNLKSDGCSGIIETEKGYYIVKCVNDYLEDRTAENKISIIEDMKNKAFIDKFEPFLNKQKVDFNDDVWEKIHISDYESVQSDNIFGIYEIFLQQ